MARPRALSERQRAWLAEELEAWRGLGLVSDDQGARILDLYETAAEIAERKQSRAVLTLMAVAGVLASLAALLLVAYNWEAMPRAVKILIVFGAIGGSHATGYQLRASGAARVFSDVAFFVGCLLYGAGIWLVAQIFHLSAHYPDGLWWWALGVLPFVLALDARLFHLLLASLLALWVGFEILNFNHLGAWLFGRRSWLPNGAYTLPLFAAAGLRLAYDRRSAGTVGTYVALLAWWAGLQPIAWRWPVSPAYFVAGVGGLFLLASRLHEPGDRLAVPYRLFGALLLGGALAPLSFYSFNADAGTRAGLDWSALVPTLAANGGMVLLAFGLMRIGLKEDRGRPFSAGVGYFLLWAVLRYFDLFGGFGGFLGAAGMFLASAAALFGMALYWRRRKETARA